MFLAAFLADLRQAYAGDRNRPAVNCVALLDNVDAPGGTRFLDLLLDLRQQLPPDPLVVLAASRQWQPPLDAGEFADSAGTPEWEQHRSTWWFPVEL